jgi:hypothetical protein
MHEPLIYSLLLFSWYLLLYLVCILNCINWCMFLFNMFVYMIACVVPESLCTLLDYCDEIQFNSIQFKVLFKVDIKHTYITSSNELLKYNKTTHTIMYTNILNIWIAIAGALWEAGLACHSRASVFTPGFRETLLSILT